MFASQKPTLFRHSSAALHARAPRKTHVSFKIARATGQVIATREEGKNGLLIEMLQQRGIPAFELPLIEATTGPDTEHLPTVLKSEAFDWIVLTSPEAASVFIQGWRDAGCPPVRIASVGKGTSRILNDAPEASELAPAFEPTKANAVHLSAEMPLTKLREDVGPPKVLYPASAKAAQTLQNGLAERGFDVVRLNTYDTVPVQHVASDLLEQAKACAVVSVASPSALKAWIGLVGMQVAESMPVACIGSTSGNAALKAGLPREKVFWDEDPGMEGFVRSIELALDACSVKC